MAPLLPSDVLQMLRLAGVEGNRQRHLRQSGMDSWQKESLGFQGDDFIIWQDEAVRAQTYNTKLRLPKPFLRFSESP